MVHISAGTAAMVLALVVGKRAGFPGKLARPHSLPMVMLGWMATEAVRYKAATSLGAASGVVAGLVAITPAAGALTPLTSIFLGAVGGVLACLGYWHLSHCLANQDDHWLAN